MPTEQEIEAEIVRKGLTAPRITPIFIDSLIVKEDYHVFPGSRVTVCALFLKNGYVVVGEGAAAHSANFDAETGRQAARRVAREKIWPLAGYALREQLTQAHDLALEVAAEAQAEADAQAQTAL
jgi:hypothetical protein